MRKKRGVYRAEGTHPYGPYVNALNYMGVKKAIDIWEAKEITTKERLMDMVLRGSPKAQAIYRSQGMIWWRRGGKDILTYQELNTPLFGCVLVTVIAFAPIVRVLSPVAVAEHVVDR